MDVLAVRWNAQSLGRDQQHPSSTEQTERHLAAEGSGGSAAAPDQGAIPGTGITPTHPSREGSPRKPTEGVAAPPLRPTRAQEQQPTIEKSLPTSSKEREKQNDAENKERGIEKVVKKKPKLIEKHYDDCGDDLRGLCAFQHCKDCQCGDGYSSSSDEESGIPILQHDQSQYLPTYWFSPVLQPWEQLQLHADD